MKYTEKLQLKVNELESSIADFYNVITRTDLTIGEIVELNTYCNIMWENFTDAIYLIKYSSVDEIKNELDFIDAYKPRKEIFTITARTIDLIKIWMKSIADIEVGRCVPFLKGQWLELVQDNISASLTEIRDFQSWFDERIKND